MKIIRAVLLLILTVVFVTIGNNQLINLPVIGQQVKGSEAAQLPPLGKFFSPFEGFWQNAQNDVAVYNQHINSEYLQDKVNVIYDERLVPHIFAQNNNDTYYAMGYISAQMRLFQMELQVMATAGRLSEIFGSRTINYDKQQREMGLTYGAEQSVDLLKNDPTAKATIGAYTEGVNDYIAGLSYRDLPIEYKLLDFKPEAWNELKSALLVKRMAQNLASRSHDLQYTQLLFLLGEQDFFKLYPDYIKGQVPIIPSDTDYSEYGATAAKQPDVPLISEDSLKMGQLLDWMPDDNVGSNNWAINASKTATGSPILCSDPHLPLTLPSIWLEMQLHNPELNVYGVTIPGAPSILIGFNENIAWGITNSGRDVLDWYKVRFKDNTKSEYAFDNNWEKTTKRAEIIKVRNDEPIVDTIIYTHHGPVVEKKVAEQTYNMAMRWTAHDPSNEFYTFHLLNRAKNYEEYAKALTHYDCPGQNFVFADVNNDIAIWQQGKFPNKYQGQGRFILDGSQSAYDWQGFIPQQENPHVRNPKRNFVSSANQHPTTTDYPYYYAGPKFEYFRNRRINSQLATMNDITIEQMQILQTDNYNLLAAETLPTMLDHLNPDTMSELEEEAYQLLSKWNYMNNDELRAPSFFDAFWNQVCYATYDEVNNGNKKEFILKPTNYMLSQLIVLEPNSHLFDIEATEQKETCKDICRQAFAVAVQHMEKWMKTTGKPQIWYMYRGSNIKHLARIEPFGIKNVKIGGDAGIVNAMNGIAGPSWRMVVSLEKPVKAWGIYPGGQSGSPGSPYYQNFIDDWAAGKYYEINFMQNITDTNQQAEPLFTQLFE